MAIKSFLSAIAALTLFSCHPAPAYAASERAEFCGKYVADVGTTLDGVVTILRGAHTDAEAAQADKTALNFLTAVGQTHYGLYVVQGVLYAMDGLSSGRSDKVLARELFESCVKRREV